MGPRKADTWYYQVAMRSAFTWKDMGAPEGNLSTHVWSWVTGVMMGASGGHTY